MNQVTKDLQRLATFPEQNPNPVMEFNLAGEITYLNPASKNHFPDIKEKKLNHPLFTEINKIIAARNHEELNGLKCEVQANNSIYEQKIYFIKGSDTIRVYSSDITIIRENEKKMARLATFPEQNPNPVLEVSMDGIVTYVNPVAAKRFPDLLTIGIRHPVFDILNNNGDFFNQHPNQNLVGELRIGDYFYEQKICFIPEANIIRVYSVDITERKKTESVIQQKNTALNQQNEEIASQRDLIEKQKHFVEEKQKEMFDSINYARRIQYAILPSEEELKKCLDDHFVLFQPKDIVSGDFYWCISTTTSDTNAQLSIIAAVDCTGHGVPGAFMSMLGYTLLNQTIKNPKVNSPAEVLNFLNTELPKNLKSGEQESSIRDGMDIVLCAIDFSNKKLYFAGANNPCWIIRGNECIALKPDKQPISASTDMEKKDFTNQEFDLQKGDIVYLFTDGYADQFGGPKGKKYKYKQLEEKLISVHQFPMAKQKELLKKDFAEWKGDLEQIDDVLVIGVRI